MSTSLIDFTSRFISGGSRSLSLSLSLPADELVLVSIHCPSPTASFKVLVTDKKKLKSARHVILKVATEKVAAAKLKKKTKKNKLVVNSFDEILAHSCVVVVVSSGFSSAFPFTTPTPAQGIGYNWGERPFFLLVAQTTIQNG